MSLDAELEERILGEFSTRARRSGLKAVVMADLARDLQVSTKTVYRVFPTKAALVHRMMERWAGRFDADLLGLSETEQMPFVDQLLQTSEVWQTSRRRFSAMFWDELERDYPDSYQLIVDARARLRASIFERLGPHMVDGLVPEVTMDLFDALLAHALDPAVQSRLGIDGRVAVRHAVRVWADGALVHPLARRPPRARRRPATGD